jgi:(p)ppGpp synthase/HD superfamily hydrolase
MLTDRFEEALTCAARFHRSQRRKGGDIPYFSHLMAVTALVLEHGGTEEEAIAALLHDAIEDGGGETARREIEQRFGAAVLAIVEGCTDADTIPKPPWEERKRAFLDRLAGASASVRLVCAADKLHNASVTLRDFRRFGDTIWSRFRGGKEGTLGYYRRVVAVLRAAEDTPIIHELDRVVTEMEQAVARAQPD